MPDAATDQAILGGLILVTFGLIIGATVNMIYTLLANRDGWKTTIKFFAGALLSVLALFLYKKHADVVAGESSFSFVALVLIGLTGAILIIGHYLLMRRIMPVLIADPRNQKYGLFPEKK